MGSSQEPFGESRLPEGSGNIARSHKAEEKKKKLREMIRYIALVEGENASYHDNNNQSWTETQRLGFYSRQDL